MISKGDMIFIFVCAVVLTVSVYLNLEYSNHAKKDLEFILSADCSEVKLYIQDGLVNGSKSQQQKAESYYMLNCIDS